MSLVKTKSYGRPKLKASELCLRRIGKHFTMANELLELHRNAGDELRESGRGKQPFNTYIKSLQSTIALHQEYLSLLAITADEAGLELDTRYEITDADKEAPWEKLKATFRDSDDKAMPLAREFKERQTVFSSKLSRYNKDYPYLDWATFWFEAEVNASKRIARQAVMSFEYLGEDCLTLDQALVTPQAKKGRETYANKQGIKEQSKMLKMHAKIVRYQNRLRKEVDDSPIDMMDLNNTSIIRKLKGDQKVMSIFKLNKKILNMEIELGDELANASALEIKEFDLAMAKKERLPLVKLKNKGRLTPIQAVRLEKIDLKVQSIRDDIEQLKESQDQLAA